MRVKEKQKNGRLDFLEARKNELTAMSAQF